MMNTNGFYTEDQCDLQEFSALCGQTTDATSLPYASEIIKNVPIYLAQDLAPLMGDQEQRRAVMGEFAQILSDGAGVFVIKNAQPDHDAIDRATTCFEGIIAREKTAGGSGADHFAAAGSNDRVWNALQKHCEADPEGFLRYFDSPTIDAACESWLGPNYQMTAQVNLVHPGGKAQQAHRDYHLGFQTADICATYPAHVHDLSPLMTLQGGIAHCDMPIESGPTKLLPFSQAYRPGYAAWRRDDFRAYFESHHIQVPLNKGDAIFFNPALFHAAGENMSADIHRFVNLLQVSSAFGRAMETINRHKICALSYYAFSMLYHSGEFNEQQLDAALSVTAEGYSFPTNLDLDPPVGGLAPVTQKTLMKEAILAKTPRDTLIEALDALKSRQLA